MKKFLSIICLFSIVALLPACDNGDSGGSSGANIPEVSWDLYDTSNWVTCFKRRPERRYQPIPELCVELWDSERVDAPLLQDSLFLG